MKPSSLKRVVYTAEPPTAVLTDAQALSAMLLLLAELDTTLHVLVLILNLQSAGISPEALSSHSVTAI